jgi:uncharacterized protein (UPF0297 family)
MTSLTSLNNSATTDKHENLTKVLNLILENPDNFYWENPFSPVRYTFQEFVKLVKGGMQVGDNVSPYGSADLDEWLGISVEDYDTLTEFEALTQIEMAVGQIIAGEPVRVPYHLDPEDDKRDSMVDGFIEALTFGCGFDEGTEIENYDALREAVEVAVNNFIGYLTHGDIMRARECESWEKIGHDLYFTAVGAGAGFWDGDYRHDEDPHLGNRLTESAKLCGMPDVDLYEGDDENIYACGFS